MMNAMIEISLIIFSLISHVDHIVSKIVLNNNRYHAV